MSDIKLSILIPVHTAHLNLFYQLYEHLKKQVRDLKKETEVEILYNVDEGQLTTGMKRNLLMDAAKGEMIVYIDSDDWVPDYYVDELLKAVKMDCDCVAINGTYSCDNGKPIRWFLAKDNPNDTVHHKGENYFRRTTNHLSMVRKSLAMQARFTDKSNAEDRDYSLALNPLLKTEYTIHPPMYEYRYISRNKLYK